MKEIDENKRYKLIDGRVGRFTLVPKPGVGEPWPEGVMEATLARMLISREAQDGESSTPYQPFGDSELLSAKQQTETTQTISGSDAL